MKLISTNVALDVRECGHRSDQVSDFSVSTEVKGERRGWLVDVQRRNGRRRSLSISIHMNDTGAEPIVLVDAERLFVGAESVVGCFDFAIRAVSWLHDMGAVVQDLYVVGGDLLAIGEHRVVKILREGAIEWSVDTDLISDYSLESDDALQLRFLDDDPVRVDVATGESSAD